MSVNSSYCNVSFTNNNEIILTIDLRKKESSPTHLSKKHKQKVESLYSHAEAEITILNEIVDALPLDISSRNPDKTVRKLAKKIIKYKRIRLSELAAQLNVEKNYIKVWFNKGRNAEGDETDYITLLKCWLLTFIESLSGKEIYDIINSFNKDKQKNSDRLPLEISANSTTHPIESIVIDPRFPFQKFSKKELYVNPLISMHIDAAFQDISISDTFLWDRENTSEDALTQFASSVVMDGFEKQSNNNNQDVKQSILSTITHSMMFIDLLDQIVTQMKKQITQSSDSNNQIAHVIEFNASSTNYVQKEQIIKISLNIDQNNIKLRDTFDWDIDFTNNVPELFAQNYVKENQIPMCFAPIISTQIQQQIDDFIQKRLKKFSELFRIKLSENNNAEFNVFEEKKRTNLQIRRNILNSFHESLESFPIELPSRSDSFLKNEELFTLINKYSDLLSNKHKQIFNQQKYSRIHANSILSKQSSDSLVQGLPYKINQSNSKLFSSFQENIPSQTRNLSDASSHPIQLNPPMEIKREFENKQRVLSSLTNKFEPPSVKINQNSSIALSKFVEPITVNLHDQSQIRSSHHLKHTEDSSQLYSEF